MNYTTNDVRFQIPQYYASDLTQQHRTDLLHIQMHCQGLWNTYFADGTPILTLHPYISILDNDEVGVAQASTPMDYEDMTQEQNAMMNVNFSKVASYLDYFGVFMHEMAHIHEYMTQTPEQNKKANDRYENERELFDQWEKQSMDSHWTAREQARQQGATNPELFEMDVQDIIKHKEKYARITDESSMIDIVMKKVPNLYTSRQSYLYRFHGVCTQMKEHIANKQMSESGKIITRQKIEKLFTPVAKKYLPQELHRHWNYLVYTMNSDGVRSLDNDNVGKQQCINNESDTRGYTLMSMAQWLKKHRTDFIHLFDKAKLNWSNDLQKYVNNSPFITAEEWSTITQ